MKTLVIEKNNKLYAQLVDPSEASKNNTEWIGKSYESLQGSVMRYDGEKIFRNHRHILNPRTIKRTQEAFVVIKGIITVTIFDEKTKNYIGELIASQGMAIFVWNGFHELVFNEKDTIAYEVKAGSFSTVEEDKEFYDTAV